MALSPVELEGGSLWGGGGGGGEAGRRGRAHLLGMRKSGQVPVGLGPIAPSPSLKTSPWADCTSAQLSPASPGPPAQHLPAHHPRGSGPHRRQGPWRVRGYVCVERLERVCGTGRGDLLVTVTCTETGVMPSTLRSPLSPGLP